MSIIIPANTLATGGFDVDNSLRFNDGSSDNLSRTTETPTNADKYTFSTWIKRSSLGASNMKIFGVQGANANEQNLLEFNADDLVWMQTDASGGNTVYRLRTDRKFRDPSAWYHIVVAYDSSQGTANNRIRMYINGVEETSFSTRTNPSANLDSLINSSVSATAGRTLRLGRTGDNGGQYFDGYMSEVCFIDGQQLAPTSFGEFDEDSGIWKPIDGLADDLTFGNNGFYLEFKQAGTGTNASGMGADTSGNTNHFAVNNLTATDQSTDTCTNNFCTINSLDNLYAAATLAEGNLKVTCSAGNTSFITSTFGLTKGKWYWEAKLTTVGGEEAIGITDIVSTATDNYAGQTANSYSFKGNNGNIRNADENESYGSAYGTSVIGVYMDLDNNKLYFAINGTIQASGAGFDITAAASTTNGFYFPMVGDVDSDSPVWEVNFGNPVSALSSAVSDANGFGSFEYSPSDGGSASFDSAVKSFLAICTKNLAESG